MSISPPELRELDLLVAEEFLKEAQARHKAYLGLGPHWEKRAQDNPEHADHYKEQNHKLVTTSAGKLAVAAAAVAAAEAAIAEAAVERGLSRSKLGN